VGSSHEVDRPFRAARAVGNPLPKCGPSVAGRWPFPPPPWPWAVAGLTFEVFPRHRPSPDRSQVSSALVDLISSSKLSLASGGRLAPDSPLVGFVLKVPSTDTPFARPLPGAEAPLGPTLPSARSCSVLVVPPHLDGFLRAEVAGLLHPAIGHGVRRVSDWPRQRLTPPGGGASTRDD
jgi:hypothetical protein